MIISWVEVQTAYERAALSKQHKNTSGSWDADYVIKTAALRMTYCRSS